MKKLKLFALTAVALMGVTGVANAETVMLAQDDFVGISFWLVSMACLAATVFFFLERSSVPAGWRVSMTVAGLVTGIAFVHYIYMREVWIMTGESPTVYRYIDWLITVPLLMLEFYFVLAAVRKISGGIFWRLLIGSLVMLIGGYLGEAGYMNAIPVTRPATVIETLHPAGTELLSKKKNTVAAKQAIDTNQNEIPTKSS